MKILLEVEVTPVEMADLAWRAATWFKAVLIRIAVIGLALGLYGSTPAA